mmetsp:Transcript_10615/g.26763  ORF Transcript_10615/g.26763 Transcript_10615/m.26763 type:complete len:346 (-) Transcript_10615:573-1610(-)
MSRAGRGGSLKSVEVSALGRSFNRPWKFVGSTARRRRSSSLNSCICSSVASAAKKCRRHSASVTASGAIISATRDHGTSRHEPQPLPAAQCAFTSSRSFLSSTWAHTRALPERSSIGSSMLQYLSRHCASVRLGTVSCTFTHGSLQSRLEAMGAVRARVSADACTLTEDSSSTSSYASHFPLLISGASVFVKRSMHCVLVRSGMSQETACQWPRPCFATAARNISSSSADQACRVMLGLSERWYLFTSSMRGRVFGCPSWDIPSWKSLVISSQLRMPSAASCTRRASSCALQLPPVSTPALKGETAHCRSHSSAVTGIAAAPLIACVSACATSDQKASSGGPAAA